MIIVPELETAFILVPRTGSGTLWRALRARYERAFMPYRHMEADGVPHGYDRWRRIGVMRHPVDRLWSLYNQLKVFNITENEAWNKQERDAVARPFDEWLLTNARLFAPAYNGKALAFGSMRAGKSAEYMPWLAQMHPLPENVKSQFHYLRPDLGTVIWDFEQLPKLLRELDVDGHLDTSQKTVHATKKGPTPLLSGAALEHVEKTFRWDLQYGGYQVNPSVADAA